MAQDNTRQGDRLSISLVNLFTAMLNHPTQQPVQPIMANEKTMDTTTQDPTVGTAKAIFGDTAYQKYAPLLEKRATITQEEAMEALQAITNQDIGEVLLRVESEMRIGKPNVTYHRANEVSDHHLFRGGQELVDKVFSGEVSTERDAVDSFTKSRLGSIATGYTDRNILFNNSQVRSVVVTLLEAAYPGYQCKEASHRALIFEKVGQIRDEDLRILLMDPVGEIVKNFIYSGLNIPATATKDEINKLLYTLPRGIKNKKYLNLALGHAFTIDDAGNHRAVPHDEALGVYVNDIYDEFFEKGKPHINEALAIAQKDSQLAKAGNEPKMDDYVQAARRIMLAYHGKL